VFDPGAAIVPENEPVNEVAVTPALNVAAPVVLTISNALLLPSTPNLSPPN
jgi:hypothetical protein